jgi:hypothetical protein
MIRKLIYSAIVIISLSACKKEINLNLPENERKLVVNGVFCVGEPINVLVSKSKSVLENNDVESVDNAEIKLYENGIYLTTLIPEKQFWYTKINSLIVPVKIDTIFRNRYFSKIQLVVPEKSYRIEVSAPGIDKKATVEFIAPKFTHIFKIDTLTLYTSGREYYRQFDVQINDRVNEENFYIIQLKVKRKSSYQDKSGKKVVQESISIQNIESDDVLFSSGNFTINTGLLFNDQLFDGKQKSIRIKTMEYFNTYTMVTNYEASNKYLVILKSISKDYYNYLVGINMYNIANENPIAEPAGVKSNVKNGLGIVTAVNQWIDSSIVVKIY